MCIATKFNFSFLRQLVQVRRVTFLHNCQLGNVECNTMLGHVKRTVLNEGLLLRKVTSNTNFKLDLSTLEMFLVDVAVFLRNCMIGRFLFASVRVYLGFHNPVLCKPIQSLPKI